MKKEEIKNFQNKKKRPPVVVVLGHVDHGKSSLLEAIKDLKITSKEVGGITQHIGAYEVEEKEHKITFIDTPGHEAFSAMRARGAQVADIALLVIDSAQSVQAQTKEAINIIKKTQIPMIVVLNKIDLPTANPEKIKRELAQCGVLVESLGGDIPSVEVSAKEKRGINELLEMILLVAEMHQLESEEDLAVEGVIIESYLDSKMGPIASAIVKKGVLNKKDIIGTDSAVAKIRSLKNFQGKEIEKAFPSQPVVILGFDKVPSVGEKFKSYKTVEEALEKVRKEAPKREVGVGVLEKEEDKKLLNLVIKADVLGSLEAIELMLKSIPQEKVALRILKLEVGDINENDVKLAEMGKAEIIGFRVKVTPAVAKFMKSDAGKKVRIKNFNIIYDLIQDIRKSLERTVEPEIVIKVIGKLKILAIFWAERNRQIVGGRIVEGELRRGLKIDVFRGEEKIGTGKLINLQKNKKDVDRLVKGDEAGILFEGNIKIEKGDLLVAFIEEKQKIDF